MTPTIDADLHVDSDGWLSGTDRILSPNYDARPAGQPIRLIVIHAISLPPGEFGGTAVTDFFTSRLDPAAHPYFAAIAGHRVSTHFFIRRDGRLMQFVSCLQRAWHAGVSCWRREERCNDFSLGIELEGDDRSDFTAAQYCALESLIAALYKRFPIEASVGHADIAPGRKTDPGPHFDWLRLVPLRAAS
ncbi:MAG: 1,6-anhydro-N-acetylmuramyl-L-alanine amidase AmpD [Rhodocyclaceae bacterium]|nr:1,6-anhydro-N-acetylmuramyl-L-alanine amidase AmpD [Rhodocyclaceae bacterium]